MDSLLHSRNVRAVKKVVKENLANKFRRKKKKKEDYMDRKSHRYNFLWFVLHNLYWPSGKGENDHKDSLRFLYYINFMIPILQIWLLCKHEEMGQRNCNKQGHCWNKRLFCRVCEIVFFERLIEVGQNESSWKVTVKKLIEFCSEKKKKFF